MKLAIALKTITLKNKFGMNKSNLIQITKSNLIQITKSNLNQITKHLTKCIDVEECARVFLVLIGVV